MAITLVLEAKVEHDCLEFTRLRAKYLEIGMSLAMAQDHAYLMVKQGRERLDKLERAHDKETADLRKSLVKAEAKEARILAKGTKAEEVRLAKKASGKYGLRKY